ncbi:hypothetical protein FRC18_001572 [Serendipita sp. 400]|nr:hypothetical protein FRC18_001572 [Serendipita sp. 400]
MVRSWGKKNRTPIYSEEVVIAEPGSDDPNPWIHWIGECPRGPTTRKVVLYIHGGGFVLPLSEGHLPMMTSLLREAKQEIKPPPLLVAAEYTLAPYGQYPTQLRQCISIIRYLHQRYGVDSSNLLIAGDSCGGALGLSILSQLLHPSPTLPLLPYTSGVSKPLAGLLLISPWTSFSTSAGSYNENAGKDTLPPDIIRRFRDTYISRSSLAPGSEADPLKVSSTTGPWYRSTPDPLVTGLKEGIGAIRPPGHSQQETQQEGWYLIDLTQSIEVAEVINEGKSQTIQEAIIPEGPSAGSIRVRKEYEADDADNATNKDVEEQDTGGDARDGEPPTKKLKISGAQRRKSAREERKKRLEEKKRRGV